MLEYTPNGYVWNNEIPECIGTRKHHCPFWECPFGLACINIWNDNHPWHGTILRRFYNWLKKVI